MVIKCMYASSYLALASDVLAVQSTGSALPAKETKGICSPSMDTSKLRIIREFCSTENVWKISLDQEVARKTLQT